MTDEQFKNLNLAFLNANKILEEINIQNLINLEIFKNKCILTEEEIKKSKELKNEIEDLFNDEINLLLTQKTELTNKRIKLTEEHEKMSLDYSKLIELLNENEELNVLNNTQFETEKKVCEELRLLEEKRTNQVVDMELEKEIKAKREELKNITYSNMEKYLKRQKELLIELDNKKCSEFFKKEKEIMEELNFIELKLKIYNEHKKNISEKYKKILEYDKENKVIEIKREFNEIIEPLEKQKQELIKTYYALKELTTSLKEIEL